MKAYNLLKRQIILMIVCLFITQAGLSLLAQDNAVDLDMLNYVHVSESVVLLHSEKVHGSNMACVSLDDGLVFIDCTLFTEIAARFREDMEKKFHKKTLALVMTHAHIDHFFGMAAFSDVKVIAAETSKELFQRQLNIDFEERVEGYERVFPKFGKALEAAKPFLPTEWFGKETALGSGKNQLIFRNTGGHSSGSSYGYFPSEKVLIAGDLVQVDQHAYFGDPTTDMNAWIGALKKWEGMTVEKVCPGHGRAVDKSYLVSIRVFFEDLISALKKLKEENMPVEEVVRHSSLPKGYWPDGLEKPSWYDYAIAVVYRGL